jgi:hypothetical protein
MSGAQRVHDTELLKKQCIMKGVDPEEIKGCEYSTSTPLPTPPPKSSYSTATSHRCYGNACIPFLSHPAPHLDVYSTSFTPTYLTPLARSLAPPHHHTHRHRCVPVRRTAARRRGHWIGACCDAFPWSRQRSQDLNIPPRPPAPHTLRNLPKNTLSNASRDS